MFFSSLLQKRIIYNRVGKCGSRTMIQLMISLTGKLNYTVIGSTKNNILHLNLREQVTITSFIQQLHKSEPGEISIISISCPPKRSPKTSRNPEISPCTSRRRSLTTLVGSGFVITAQVSKSWLSVRVN